MTPPTSSLNETNKILATKRERGGRKPDFRTCRSNDQETTAYPRKTIEPFTLISLPERAWLSHPWPLSAPPCKPPSLITCRTFPGVVRFLNLSWHFRSVFGPFFFSFRFVCVRVLEHDTVGEPGAVAGVSGCWEVEGGVARSSAAALAPRRCVCLETREMHERALSGLHL